MALNTRTPRTDPNWHNRPPGLVSPTNGHGLGMEPPVTLLIDPPLLLATGAAIERLVEDEAIRRRLEMAATATVAAAGIGFYCNARWTRPFWPLLRIDSGRDWMLNSWILPLDDRGGSPALHVVAAVAFATYPVWTRLGRRLGHRL